MWQCLFSIQEGLYYYEGFLQTQSRGVAVRWSNTCWWGTWTATMERIQSSYGVLYFVHWVHLNNQLEFLLFNHGQINWPSHHKHHYLSPCNILRSFVQDSQWWTKWCCTYTVSFSKRGYSGLFRQWEVPSEKVGVLRTLSFKVTLYVWSMGVLWYLYSYYLYALSPVWLDPPKHSVRGYALCHLQQLPQYQNQRPRQPIGASHSAMPK